ncbi:polysaccharide deacetylase family protein [Cohnella sp. WQ 127256]|uniref:polysaccharide deacetylase family protein n=1 Tax=Cohnella sp. WQ 127256 TaxID=2938790 RepID=UPI002118DCB4|nr:polysaccharide deacetylase family protein [Cohnella sp. WQ 127256]
MAWKLSSALMLSFAGLLLTTGFTVQPVNKTRKDYEATGDIVWEVPMKEKLIALTFDDGPSPRTTPMILDLLARNEAKATFFVVGKRVEQFPDVIKREALEGHEVANHTYSHIYFNRQVSAVKITDELARTQKMITDLTGQNCQWFRPPGGFFNDKVIYTARKNGYTLVLWSWHQDTKDWSTPGVDKIVNKVLNNLRNGDIVLLHDHINGSLQTVRALEKILPELKKRGYTMVTVTELLRHKKPKTQLSIIEETKRHPIGK